MRRPLTFVRLVLAAIAALLQMQAASAADTTGFYVGAGAGFNYTEQQSTALSVFANPPAGIRVPTRPMNLGAGFAVLGSGGYALGNGVRLELEANVRRNGLDHVAGSETKYGVYVNGLYDLDIGMPWVVPYGGVGVGYEAVDLGNVTIRSAVGGPQSSDGGTVGRFGLQGIVGASFPVPGWLGLSLTAEYRYMRLVGSRNYSGVTDAPVQAANRLRVGNDASHAVVVGLRYGFNVPPPAAAAPEDNAAPPPLAGIAAPPSRSYVVYFDPNSSALSARARDVIAEAARASARLAYTRIEVSGHSDRSSSSASNVALSGARAAAVADELVRWGLLRNVIEIHSFGDERPIAVGTSGISEPRNRRVEILYR